MSKITTLYLTRNGLLEPLGQSQVLPYLRGLARQYEVILITREKADDWATEASAATRAECAALGIDWRPKTFRPHPRYVGPARDTLSMIREALLTVRNRKVQLIHARSYIPAAVAWAVSRLTGTPFIFDMRALWPEELITAKRLRRGSLVHRAIVAAERLFVKDSAAVVSLTHGAVEHLQTRYPKALYGKPVAIIPTCADLNRFSPRSERKTGPRVHSCIGTLFSGWFRIDWLQRWFAGVAENDTSALFEIVTRDEPSEVRRAVDPAGALGDRLAIGSRLHAEMPGAIRAHDVSVMFFTGGAE